VVFAPRLGSTAEDDGYLLTFVADEQTGESELHVMDAADAEREPVARVKIPQRVPTGYHAWWIPAADLARQRPLA
jgi:carotenoid cleavage dioxygenase-like enzyme